MPNSGFDIWRHHVGDIGEHRIRCRKCGFTAAGFYATSTTTLLMDQMCQCHSRKEPSDAERD